MRTPTKNEVILAQLAADGVVAMPTDTVYGLHCSPHSSSALEKMLTLKQRAPEKGLILIADSLERFAEFINPLPDDIATKIRNTPGVTWLVPARAHISPLITGKFSTVAIRICLDPRIAELSRELNSPIVSTSANIAHHPVAQNVAEIKQIFPVGVDLIVDGGNIVGVMPSQIRDAFTDERLR